MVSIVTKRINGNEYLYLVRSIRKKDKVIQKTIKYVGEKRPIPIQEFECMKLSYKNEDWVLDEFNDELSYKDHQKMKKASDLHKEHINRLDKVSKEKEREKFLSLFISNSNGIEGSTLNFKDTFNYLFKDITPKGHPKKELFMASNMLQAWEYMEERHKRMPKEDDLLEMHKLVNKEIETEETLGKYKNVQNYVGGISTTSYLFTKEKMKQLMQWIKKAFRKMNEFEAAFQSHAQFEIIHPFIDGNGRVGRLLMNWLLMNKRLMPIAIHVNKRGDYISALNNTRRGKIEAICRFCYKEYINQYKFVG